MGKGERDGEGKGREEEGRVGRWREVELECWALEIEDWW